MATGWRTTVNFIFTHRRVLVCAFVTVLMSLMASAAIAAQYDPALNWRTISTPHFRIHFPESIRPGGTALARIAEEVYPVVTGAFGHEPDDITDVILVDNTDAANGMATAVPYNWIKLFAVAPTAFSSLSDYDGWLKTVFIHEYAHVLTLGYRRGYAKVMQKIFGTVGLPTTIYSLPVWFVAAPTNLFLPPWFHEGMAVNFESELTGKGRKNSTYYDMVYRVDVAENSIPPLDRLGGDFPSWPSGHTRYIYGSKLMGMVVEEKELGGLGELARKHGGRFPYTIDSPPYTTAGATYQQLYTRMREQLYAEHTPTVDAIKRKGVTPFKKLTNSGWVADGPRWLDGEHLLYTKKSPYGPTSMQLFEVEGGEESELAPRPGAQSRPAILVDGRGDSSGDGTIIFQRFATWKPWAGLTTYSDLYSMKVGDWCSDRLTSGARLRYVDALPGGKGFVGVRNTSTGQELILFSLGEDGVEDARVVLSEGGVVYDHPAVAPDGKRVAFVRKTSSGTSRLAIADIGSGAVRLVTPEGSRAGFPDWSPDSSDIVFTWDRDGIPNLYRMDAVSGEIERLTRVVGGAFWPAHSPDGKRLAFVSYSSTGFDLAVMEMSDALEEDAGGWSVEKLTPEPSPAAAPKEGGAEGSEAGDEVGDEVAERGDRTDYSEESYSGAGRLIPSFWLPDLEIDNGGVAPGVWTTGTDPLGIHSYYVGGFWSLELDRFYGGAAYAYDGWYPTITLTGSKFPEEHSNLLGGMDYYEEERVVGIEFEQELHGMLRKASVSLGWDWIEVERLSRVDEDLESRADLAALPFEGRQSALWASLTYNSASAYQSVPFTLTAESGRYLETTFRWRDEAVGSERESRELLGRWSEYFRLPWVERTALSLTAKGGVGRGEETVQSLFAAGGYKGDFPLRGYPSRTIRAEKLGTASAELHTPIWSPFRGVLDWPAFMSRMWAVGFFDVGRTWDGSDDELRKGAGVELKSSTLVGYLIDMVVTLGYGHGFDEGGDDLVYLKISLGGDDLD